MVIKVKNRWILGVVLIIVILGFIRVIVDSIQEEPEKISSPVEGSAETLPLVEGTADQPAKVEILMTQKGFEPGQIVRVNVGDTIVWKNQRTRSTGQIVGTQTCSEIKSPILEIGEQFEWIFNQVGRCNVVDAIFVGTAVIIDVKEN